MWRHFKKAWLLLPVLLSLAVSAQQTGNAGIELIDLPRDLSLDRKDPSGMKPAKLYGTEQQQRWIEGQVTDAETGEAIPGAATAW